MTKVTLYHLNSAEITAIVHKLRAQGLQTGQDFDFAYSPGKYDWQNLETIARHTVFTFYNESTASWFALKYQ
jgi:hypothetical protein